MSAKFFPLPLTLPKVHNIDMPVKDCIWNIAITDRDYHFILMSSKIIAPKLRHQGDICWVGKKSIMAKWLSSFVF